MSVVETHRGPKVECTNCGKELACSRILPLPTCVQMHYHCLKCHLGFVYDLYMPKEPAIVIKHGVDD